MRMGVIAATLCCVVAVSLTAHAAKAATKAPSVNINERPMQVTVVRSAAPGCEPNCAEWIAAQGQIDSSSLRKFKKVLSQIGKRRLPVLIHSIGGSVDESLAIGRLIRAKDLDVAVAKTEVLSCRAADKDCQEFAAKGGVRGRPEAYHALCASACAFVLAGGVSRHVGSRTLVGVHQLTSFETRFKVLRTYRVETRKSWFGPPVVKKTLMSEKRLDQKTVETPTADSAYKKVKTYFTEMGVTEAMMPLVMSASGKSIHWLTGRELRETKIATDFKDGEQLIDGVVDRDTPTPDDQPVKGDTPANDATPGIAATYDPLAGQALCDGSERAERGCDGVPPLKHEGGSAGAGAAIAKDRLEK